MQEDLLQFIWKNSLFNKFELRTVTGEGIKIIHPGFQNFDSGPDFFQARIQIADTLWIGNVEIHLDEKMWYQHRHHTDPAYNNVVLHVCLYANGQTFTAAGNQVPVLELDARIEPSLLLKYENMLHLEGPIPCAHVLRNLGQLHWLHALDRVFTLRLESRYRDITELLHACQNDWEQTCYSIICASIGHRINKEPMKQLARILPYRILRKHQGNRMELEALLFGTAGLLHSSFKDGYPKLLLREFEYLQKKYRLISLDAGLWKWMRMRPFSFPTLRIAQLAAWLDQPDGLLRSLLERSPEENKAFGLQLEVSEYWRNHYRFDSESSVRPGNLAEEAFINLSINALIPIIFAYATQKGDAILLEKAMTWIENLPSENNKITRFFEICGRKADNAMHSQSMIHVYNHYCVHKRCIHCPVGQSILSQNNNT